MNQSRRQFFGLFPASWTAFAGALAAAGPDSYWKMVKRQFPLDGNLIYLNAANVCPASRPVMDRHLEFLRDFHANPSFQNREKYKPMYESLRAKLALLLNAQPDEIAILRNTSEGSNTIVKGVDLKPGDEIVITDHNHPSNNDSWKIRARRDGLVVKSIPVNVPAKSREALIAEFDKAITPRTKVVAFTHLTSTTGILFPAREITELAHKRRCWVHLDGAQTFGMMDVDLKKIGCDSYAGSAHKWMMGPLEAGMLYVRAERIAEVWPSIVTAGWADDLKGARKLEVFGQRDDPRIAGFEAAVDFVNLIGIQNIEARTRALADHVKKALVKLPNLRMKTNLEPELSAGVVKFQLQRMPTQQAYDTLYERRRIAIAMTASGDSEGLRFSPHVYNDTEEIDRAVEEVRKLTA